MKKLVIVSLSMLFGVCLFSGAGDVPEFPSYTDPVMETSIQEDETPLSADITETMPETGTDEIVAGDEEVPL